MLWPFSSCFLSHGGASSCRLGGQGSIQGTQSTPMENAQQPEGDFNQPLLPASHFLQLTDSALKLYQPACVTFCLF